MKRILTALVFVPVVLLVTIFSPDWLFASAIGLTSAWALDEFLTLTERKGIGRPGRWFLAPAAFVGFSFIGGPAWVLTSFVAATLLLMTITIFDGAVETALGRVAVGLGGVGYCILTLGFLVLMMPRETILVLFGIIWIGDTSAYYGGRAIGRHLLAPKVSPKKTVEGAITGLVGSVIAGSLLGSWLLDDAWSRLIVISALTAVAGQLGDLAESVLKRSVGVKDSSSILPGHGGILDRLDSLFFAAPVFYWLLYS